MGVGLGALSLVGCGGDDDEAPPATTGGSPTGTTGTSPATPASTETSSILTPKVDTRGQARPGGIHLGWAEGDETNLDPLTNSRASRLSTGLGEPANSRIFREEPHLGSIPSEPTIVGDLAESWELAGDGLTLTVKLRNDIRFDPREPTNGRQMTAQDVVFSLNKMFSLSPFGNELSHEREPTSPIESAVAIDDLTVQYKMAFPWSPLFATMAHGRHVIQGVEADGGYDARREVRGSGPWMLESYEPSVKFTFRKHPLWHRSKDEGGIPYIDGYDAPILAEAATRVAQLRAKNIWDLSNINNSDLVSIASDVPEINIHEGEQSSGYLSMHFGSRPGSPFYDTRVRQAFSMAIDRELFGEATSGATLLARIGIDQSYAAASHISPFWGDLWLDPLTDALGEGAQFFHYNPTEATALLRAAGQENLEALAQVSSRRHGNGEESEIVAQMLNEVGINARLDVVDYQTVFLPKMWVVQPGETLGDFDGFSFGSSFGGAQHIATNIYTLQHSKGSITASRPWDEGQDKIDAIIEKMLGEFDANALKSLVHEFQKEQARYMSGVPLSSPAMSYRAAWPWVMNYNAFYTSAGGGYDALGGRIPPYLYTWIDESKM